MSRAMIIGKGSLFLGRMTNLFDGISFLMEPNPGLSEGDEIDESAVRKLIADACDKCPKAWRKAKTKGGRLWTQNS